MEAKRSKKKSKKRNWAKLKAEYCTTDISIRAIAKKYGIPYSTVNSRAIREKWTSQKEVVVKHIDAEVEEKVKANELHNELYDRGLDVAKMLLEKYMQDLREGKKRTGATAANLDYLMGAIQKAQKGQRMSLNIDNNDVIDVEPEVRIISGLDTDKI